MTDLIVHPRTGEVFNPAELPTEDLASFLHEGGEFKRNLFAALSEAEEELRRRADYENKKTLETDDFLIEVESPGNKTLWQDAETIDQLRAVLADLEEEGLISRSARDEAIASEVLYKTHSTKVKDLCRRLEIDHPDAKARIEECVKKEPKTRRVRVHEKGHK